MLNRKFLLGTVASMAVLFSVSCGNPHLSGGKLHLTQERYDRAEENFLLAVEVAPEEAEPRMLLAMAIGEQGRHEEAAAIFAEARDLALIPEMTENIDNNAEHFFSELYNDGIARNEEAGDLDEDDKEGKDEKYQEAVSLFNQALLYRPNSVEAYENLGIMHFRLEETDKALDVYDRLNQMVPDDEKVQGKLHIVYTREGNTAFQAALEAKSAEKEPAEIQRYLEAAFAFYNKADEMSPGNIDVVENRAGVAWELADIDETKKDTYLQAAKDGYAQVLVEESTNVGVLLNLSLLANATAMPEEAREYAVQLVNLDPKNGQYHINLGRIYGALDQKADMFGELIMGQALQTGTKQAPAIARQMAEDHGPRSEMLARYRETGDPDEIRVFEDAGGGEYQVWFYWSRGTGYAFQDGSLVYATTFEKVVASETD